MRQVVFLSSPEVWQRGHGLDHPMKPERLQRTHVLLDSYGAFEKQNVTVVAPRRATKEELALFHTAHYIDMVESLSQGKNLSAAGQYGFGPGDNPVFPGMFDSERRRVGSALQAAQMLVEGSCDVAFSYSGGLHHGGPDFVSGFCVFNDASVAIHYLLDQGLRVAYIDVDVHHGDGVQDAFYESDQVLTISIHQDGRTLFPGTGFADEIGSGSGSGFNVNIPLPPFTDNEIYLWAFKRIVPLLVERFNPDIVVTQLGVDTHYLDPLANLMLTTQGQTEVFEELSQISQRWLALGGGRYNIDVVPRSWTLAFGAMLETSWPEPLPEAYRAAYGGWWLHDEDESDGSVMYSPEVRSAVEGMVNRLRTLHGIDL